MIRTVLVVDDDAAVGRLVAAILRRDGIAVDTALDGAQALERLATARYDAVLTDMTMPGMSGLQLVRKAEAAGHHLPFLVMSAFLDPATEHALCEDPGVTGILRKPFDIARLLHDVRSVLERAAPAPRSSAPPDAPSPCLALAPLWLVRPGGVPFGVPTREAAAACAAGGELSGASAAAC